jgi:hypothetical protein
MKKFTKIIVVVVFTVFALNSFGQFEQNRQKTVKSEKEFTSTQYSLELKSIGINWVSYFQLSSDNKYNVTATEAGDKFGIRIIPSMVGVNNLENLKLDSVALLIADGATVDGLADYTNKNFTLEVYQGGSLDTQTGVYSIGEKKHSQDVVASDFGLFKFKLSSELDINNTQEIAIVFTAAGKSCIGISGASNQEFDMYGNLMYYTDFSAWSFVFYGSIEDPSYYSFGIHAGFQYEKEDAPILLIEPETTWNAGEVKIDEKADKEFTIKNTGTATLTISEVGTLPDGWSTDLTTSVSVDAGDEAKFKIEFAPTEEKDYIATLSIKTNAGEESITLSGKGTHGIGITDAEVNMFNIYPNPSKGSFTIKASENSNVKIIDLTGKVVETFNINANADIKLTQPAGMYFVQIEGNGKIRTEKLIIE